MVSRFVPGQRWLSQTEPELGLGLVIKSEPDKVTIHFPSSDTTRVYTIEAPPLTRVRFSVGDVLKTNDGRSFVVEDLAEKDGHVTYLSKGKKIDESRLSDSLTFSKPMDRLLNGQVDEKGIYNLRHRALYRRFKTYRSPLRGLLAGRFLPAGHQLYVATQATRVAHPRVLLADQLGLGRRVEAGLILQRLHLAGNATRVLLTAPEAQLPLIETELSRRFGFVFRRLDAEAVDISDKAKKSSNGKAEPPNPFRKKGDWLSLPLEVLKSKTAHLAAAAGWDVVIVDGAETLDWNEEKPGLHYRGVEEVAEASKSLILLSSKGPEEDADGHFGRVRLLDPEEFSTSRRYHRHQNELADMAAAVQKIASVDAPDRECEALLRPIVAADPRAKELLKSWRESREMAKDILLEHLLDGQECGRSVFRCTSDQVRLPVREVEFVRMETKPEVRDEMREEHKQFGKSEDSTKRTRMHPSAADAPLAVWLSSLIAPPVLPPPPPPPKGSALPPPPEVPPPPPPPKALVVCVDRGRALCAGKALLKKVPDKIEIVTDAARQGLPDDWRAIVVGQEDILGRGFHGVDLVVLWDLPGDLESARAMCGILDFSGINPVRLIAPYVEDTPQELEARWLHEGLDAFCGFQPGQAAAWEEFHKEVHDLAKRIGVRHNPKLMDEMRSLAKKSRAAVESSSKKLEKHRDRMLEAASCRKGFAEQACSRMNSNDEDQSLDLFTNRVLEQCGMVIDSKIPRCSGVKWNKEATYRLEDIPKEGVSLTFSRKVSLTNESLDFLSWDHPLVAKATERLLITAVGNTAYVVWEDDRAQLVLLEGIYLAEPPEAAPELQVWRFMPPTPVRVVVSHELEDLSAQYTTELVNKNARNGRKEWLRNNARPLHNLLPGMLRNLDQRAAIKMEELAAKASNQMESVLSAEIARQQRLQETPRRKAEIKRIENQIAELKKVLSAPTLALDSLRLIRRGPSGKGI